MTNNRTEWHSIPYTHRRRNCLPVEYYYPLSRCMLSTVSALAQLEMLSKHRTPKSTSKPFFFFHEQRELLFTWINTTRTFSSSFLIWVRIYKADCAWKQLLPTKIRRPSWKPMMDKSNQGLVIDSETHPRCFYIFPQIDERFISTIIDTIYQFSTISYWKSDETFLWFLSETVCLERSLSSVGWEVELNNPITDLVE